MPQSELTPDNNKISPKSKNRISERNLLSALTLILATAAFMSSLGGAGKLVLDLLSEGITFINLLKLKILVLGLAYSFGWVSAIISIRAYKNTILPFIIKIYSWVWLFFISLLCVVILQRLFKQSYDMVHYWAYLSIVIVGFIALIGLDLLIDDQDLRPFSIPILLIGIFHLFLIVYRYVFTIATNINYIWGDIFFFIILAIVSFFMLARLKFYSSFKLKLALFLDTSAGIITPLEDNINESSNSKKKLSSNISIPAIAFTFSIGAFFAIGGLAISSSLLLGIGAILFFLTFLFVLFQ